MDRASVETHFHAVAVVGVAESMYLQYSLDVEVPQATASNGQAQTSTGSRGGADDYP